MKRKLAEDDGDATVARKQATGGAHFDVKKYFRQSLWDLGDQRKKYAESQPYKHGVISDLLIPTLLRNVRSEIQEHISFTPKETDIYRIDQSGDLANLDGLDKDTLKRLPSIQTLRDALYSADFRDYLSTVTGAGPLSGSKTDMAINVYTPGCHLLCHDDVIGSRRVSFILYLTDPEKPWRKEWGGALRLYPTQVRHIENGQDVNIPSPDHIVSIPPAFNQLSFFAVQPGESFHDVEEVYAQMEGGDREGYHRRVRMAISGWYHIPQEGETGYIQGLEAELAEKSSLMQLQGKGDKYDSPQAEFQSYTSRTTAGASLPTPSSQDDPELTKEDLDLLLAYMNPHYLTPDTLESVSDMFSEESFVLLDKFLSHKFSDRLHDELSFEESTVIAVKSDDIEANSSWKVARPPHKHRFLYLQPSAVQDDSTLNSPLQDLLKNLIPSVAFQKWLQIATDLTVKSNSTLARRFRRGKDYTLAQRYDKSVPGLELCLSLTPTKGWGDEQEEDDADSKDKPASKGKETTHESAVPSPEVGGYLAYMAGDDDDDDDAASDTGSHHGVEIPADLSTGGRATKAKKPKMDPAIYQAHDDDEEDPVLFHMPAAWNQLGIVLRDKGTMRFVKYVSQQAKGDRWDVVGEFEIEDPGEGSENENEGDVDEDALDENAMDVEDGREDVNHEINDHGTDDGNDSDDDDSDESSVL